MCTSILCSSSSQPNAHFRSNYVSKSTAVADGLVFASGSNFTLKADDTNVVSAGASGRNSVRIQSPNSYNSHVTVCVLAFYSDAFRA